MLYHQLIFFETTLKIEGIKEESLNYEASGDINKWKFNFQIFKKKYSCTVIKFLEKTKPTAFASIKCRNNQWNNLQKGLKAYLALQRLKHG